MRLSKSLLCGISALALATGAAFASEELSLTKSWTSEELSSERFSEPMNDRGTLGYYDESASMSESASLALSEQLSEPMNDRDALAYLGELDESASVSESESLVLSGPELIHYEETIVMVPSADTEMSLG
jgi:hypothetical protein